jgi:hypothetical protein
VPLLPASLTEPLWVQFSTLLKDGDRPEFVADHPWGCHRRRIPDRVVFDHVLAALVHGSGYERIATPGCSDRTIRRRLADWAERDVGVELLKAALAAYDQMIGLDLDDLSLDGSISPGWGRRWGTVGGSVDCWDQLVGAVSTQTMGWKVWNVSDAPSLVLGSFFGYAPAVVVLLAL